MHVYVHAYTRAHIFTHAAHHYFQTASEEAMRKRAEEAEAACKRMEEELERVREEENAYRVCIVHMHVTAGTRSCMHAFMNIYTNTRAHTHTHLRAYTHTYTHTNI